MAKSAQGEDRSSYQPVGPWTGLDFGIVKATEGTTWTDPTFAANWANLARAGIPRGAYAFVHPSLDPVTQAKHFIATVKARGVSPGDMLIADSELLTGAAGELLAGEHGLRRSHLLTDLSGLAVAAAGSGAHEVALIAPVGVSVGSVTHTFCAEVAAAFPHCPVMVYTNLTVAGALRSCTACPLFIAAPGLTAPTSVAPWKDWVLWQWAFGGGPGGGDRDAFNGTAAQLRAWIASYKPKPAPPPAPQPPYSEDSMPVLTGLSSDSRTWTALPVPAGKKTLLLLADQPSDVRVAFGAPGLWHLVSKGHQAVGWAASPVAVPIPAGATRVTVGGTAATPEPPVTVDWA